MIYFVQSATGGPVKIGWSKDKIVFKRRLQALQSGHPEKLVAIRTFDGHIQMEKWLHEFYSPLRLEGEWFIYRDDMLTITPPSDLPELPSYRLQLDDNKSRPPKTALMKYINENGLFQKRLARKIGVGTDSMSLYVNGLRTPRVEVQRRIEEITKGKVRMGHDWMNGKSRGESR